MQAVCAIVLKRRQQRFGQRLICVASAAIVAGTPSGPRTLSRFGNASAAGGALSAVLFAALRSTSLPATKRQPRACGARQLAGELLPARSGAQYGIHLFCPCRGLGPLHRQRVIAAVAQFEKDLLIERTLAGQARARAEGRKFGRKPVLDNEGRAKALQRLAAGASISAVAREMKASRATIMRVGRAGVPPNRL